MADSHFHIHISKRFAYLVISLSLVVFIFLIMFLGFYKAQAGKAELFAGQCLGDWQSTEKATNTPSGNGLTEENSALFTGEIKQIFCGGFYGDLPKDSTIESVTLNLKWEIFDDLPVVPDIPEADSEIPNSTETLPIEENTESTVSFGFISVAEAQEIPPADIVPSEDAVVPDSGEVKTEVPVDSNAPDGAEANEIIAPKIDDIVPTFIDTEPSQVVDNDSMFLVKYSVDGIVWEVGATITRENFHNPISLNVTSVDDLAKIKISIEPIIKAQAFKVFLDALVLDVFYTLSTELELDLFSQKNIGSDFKKFVIQNIQADAGVRLDVDSDTDQGESIILSINDKKLKPTSVFFYKEGDPSFNMTIGFGDEKLSIPTYQFSSGHFIAIFSNDSSECTNKSVASCEASSGYIAQASFDVVPTESTPLEYQDIPNIEPPIENNENKSTSLEASPIISNEETLPIESPKEEKIIEQSIPEIIPPSEETP